MNGKTRPDTPTPAEPVDAAEHLKKVREYWTEERRRAAKPLPLDVGKDDGARD